MSRKSKYAVLIVVRYPKWFGWAGLLSMAAFHFALFNKKRVAFYKLLGTGRNGTFDLRPNWNEWAIFVTTATLPDYEIHNDSFWLTNFWCGRFIATWFKLFKAKPSVTILECISTKGSWDGKVLFEPDEPNIANQKKLAVLTRATIRFSQLRSFWRNVPAVAESMANAEGLEYSVGIGEAPVYRQATFSIWTSYEHMKEFAYKQREHREVISKTRHYAWYSEEMFARFTVLFQSELSNFATNL